MTSILTAHTALKERKVFKSTVEVEMRDGLGIHLIGMADNAVKESLLRVVTALQSCGYRIPSKKIIINIAPTFLHRNTSGFDLPIAIGILKESGQVHFSTNGLYIYGELGLDGTIRQTGDERDIFQFGSKEQPTAGPFLPEEDSWPNNDGRYGYFGFATLRELIDYYEKNHYICSDR